jgi:hypothetical protein
MPNIGRLLKEPNPWSHGCQHDLKQIRVTRPWGTENRELTHAFSLLGGVLQEDRTRAKNAWERQTKLAGNLYESNQLLLETYLDEIAGSHRATRTRVLIEMAGLALALVGTVVSGVN